MSEQTPHLKDFLKDSPSNWGKWGPKDEIGSLNYLGQAEALAGAKLFKSAIVGIASCVPVACLQTTSG